MCYILGTPKDKIIHMIDFGLVKEYVDAQGIHITNKHKETLAATVRYMSINLHEHRESSK